MKSIKHKNQETIIAFLTDKKILIELKNLLNKKYPGLIDKIILYGSRVKGSANKFSDYDVLIFVYHPCTIENGCILYKDKSKRKIYVFPKDVVQETIEGKTMTNFNPKKIKGGCEQYLNAYEFINNKCT